MRAKFLLILILLTCKLFAQTQQYFQYQAVVRDANGVVLTNHTVNFKISIIPGSINGTIEYVETHNSLTNEFGIVLLQIGSGAQISGLFSSINWGNSLHFIKIEVDPSGGTNYIEMGTTQLLSVPYALYAENAGNIPTYTGGTGINVTGTIITNDAPDQIVNLTQSGATTITGSYPNYTISSTDNNSTYSAGTGINVTDTIITNTAPDQTVTLTQAGATTIIGTYPNFTISSTDLNTGTPGGASKTVQFNNSGSFAGDTALAWDNTNKRLGVGLTNPTGRVVIKGSSTALPTEPLFEVKNKAGQTVFVVYEDSVNVFVNDDAIQSNRGGFAVSGRNNSKAFTNKYLYVTPDNSKICTKDTIKGFGVENLSSGVSTSYMKLNPNNYLIGHQSGNSMTTGLFNCFLGYQAGKFNTVGYSNIFMGYKSGFNNINGQENIGMGVSSLYTNSSGNFNTALGTRSLFLNTTGSWNTAVGFEALNSNSDGNYNTAVGTQTLFSNSTGAWNTASGYQALYSNTTGIYNCAFGFKSLFSNLTGPDNTAIGYQSLYYNTNGALNSAIGYKTLYNNTSGYSNVANGNQALYSNTTGAFNVANGYFALFSNTTSNNNIGIGDYALFSNTVGIKNIATGGSALYANTDGDYNSAYGLYALTSNLSGNYNVAIGSWSLDSNKLGSYNSAVGTNALQWNKYDWNTAIGYASNSLAKYYSNTTALGAYTVITASNQVRLGDNYVTSIGGFANWTNVSDKRFKKDIKKNVPGLDFIMKLEPVTYYMDMQNIANLLNIPDSVRRKDSEILKGSILQTGFIAQDVEKAANEIGFDFSGVDKPKNENDFYGLRYAEFTVPLVKAVQELNTENTSQKNKINSLENENLKLKELINSLTLRIEKLESK